MTKKRIRILSLFAVLLLLAGSDLHAQIPQQIAYQGYLADKDGKPVNSTLTADFTLFDAANGGSQVWNQRSVDVKVFNGYYTAMLDFSTNWQNNNQQFTKQYWLEVHIGDQLLSPRFQLAASPYAMNARKADTAIVALGLVRDAPIGTIVAYGGDISFLKDREASTGWALCDGRQLKRSQFQAYYDVVRNSYGRSSDAEYVYLPDLRGMFLRGLNMDRTDAFADPDVDNREGHGPAGSKGNKGNEVGSVQEDVFASHSHSLLTNNLSNTPTTPSSDHIQVVQNYPKTPEAGTEPNLVTRTGGSETRPNNVAVYWIIKVK